MFDSLFVNYVKKYIKSSVSEEPEICKFPEHNISIEVMLDVTLELTYEPSHLGGGQFIHYAELVFDTDTGVEEIGIGIPSQVFGIEGLKIWAEMLKKKILEALYSEELLALRKQALKDKLWEKVCVHQAQKIFGLCSCYVKDGQARVSWRGELIWKKIPENIGDLWAYWSKVKAAYEVYHDLLKQQD